MDPKIQSVIDDSTALLAIVEPALAAQKEASLKVASLESKLASFEARDLTIKTAAQEAADFFHERGVLKTSREELVAEFIANPHSIFKFAQEFADASTEREAGSPDPGSTSNDPEMDPIAKFALGV